MIDTLFIISIVAALFSVICAVMAVRGQKKSNKLLKEWKESISLAQSAQESAEASVQRYQDLSSGPRYREYGDLS